MSKARLVIIAVALDGITQAEAAARYGVSEPWVSRLMVGYRAEGDAAFERHHQVRLSRATIKRVLARDGAITPEPRKRPRSSCIRFEAAMPNETWQPDFTHYRDRNEQLPDPQSWVREFPMS